LEKKRRRKDPKGIKWQSETGNRDKNPVRFSYSYSHFSLHYFFKAPANGPAPKLIKYTLKFNYKHFALALGSKMAQREKWQEW